MLLNIFNAGWMKYGRRVWVILKIYVLMKRKSMLFDINIKSGENPAVGKLLVAEPFLREKFFNHAVVAIVDYTPGDTVMGVVLNNPSEHKLQDLIPDITVKNPIPVYVGGPLGEDRLCFLHTLGDIIPDSAPVAPGLWLGGDFDALEAIVNDGYEIEGNIRFFLGYSGWSPGQLEDELKENVWAVTTPMPGENLLAGDGSALWHSCVRALGEPFKGWLYHPRNLMAN